MDTTPLLSACRQALDAEGFDAAALLQALAAAHSATPWLEQRRARVPLRVGQACERARATGRWPPRPLRRQPRPGAPTARSACWERMHVLRSGLAWPHQALAAPESEEHQRVARMLPRLRRSLGQGGGPRRPLAPAITALRMDDGTARAHAAPVGGARAARALALRRGAPVFMENARQRAVRPAVLAGHLRAAAGRVLPPFQSRPGRPGRARLRGAPPGPVRRLPGQLHDGRYRATILQRFEEKHGTQSPFVAWGALSAELLALALDCIPPAHLERLFARLLRDVQANRTGLPDLVRFWPGLPPGAERYALVEVKAPGDKLQDNQIRWLAYCVAQGIRVQVCHVQWCGPA